MERLIKEGVWTLHQTHHFELSVQIKMSQHVQPHILTASFTPQVGITLFTVSHRKSLWKHHKFYLHMDGRGNYEFKPITDETVEFGS
uniref:Uncharacterized protein n=1 Tax=Oryzias sinensis TaxID=183150 RepID=A0A8C7XSC0_9TELE